MKKITLAVFVFLFSITIWVYAWPQNSPERSFSAPTAHPQAKAPKPTFPKISVSPASANFGNYVGTTLTKTIIVKNTGKAHLQINSINITGINASDFSQSGACSTVPAGGSCNLAVTFAPGALGKRNAIMIIVSNDSKKPLVNVKLSGNAKNVCPTPGTPFTPSPTNGATGIPNNPTLGWSSSSNTDSYDVYFGTSSNPPYAGNTTSNTYSVSGLTANTPYYWKVVAKKDCGNSTSGPVWSFTTQASGPAQKPNNTPYQPEGWSGKMVIANNAGCTSTNCADNSSFLPTDTLHVSWSVINAGPVATSAVFYTALYVDGTKVYSWSSNPPLNSNYYTYVTNYSIGSLAAGMHTLEIVADSTGVIDETNENDNRYTKTITIESLASPLSEDQEELIHSFGDPDYLTLGFNSAPDRREEIWVYGSLGKTYTFWDGIRINESDLDVDAELYANAPALDPAVFAQETTLPDLADFYGDYVAVDQSGISDLIGTADFRSYYFEDTGLYAFFLNGRLAAVITVDMLEDVQPGRKKVALKSSGTRRLLRPSALSTAAQNGDAGVALALASYIVLREYGCNLEEVDPEGWYDIQQACGGVMNGQDIDKNKACKSAMDRTIRNVGIITNPALQALVSEIGQAFLSSGAVVGLTPSTAPENKPIAVSVSVRGGTPGIPVSVSGGGPTGTLDSNGAWQSSFQLPGAPGGTNIEVIVSVGSAGQTFTIEILGPPCTDYAYSPWSPEPCGLDGLQTRTATKIPSGCSGIPPTVPITERPCTPPCQSYQFSAWSACANGKNTRTYTKVPEGCAGEPDPVHLEQTCPPCLYEYNEWSACADQKQTRTIKSKWPPECGGSEPILGQECTVPCTSYTPSDSACENIPWGGIVGLGTITTTFAGVPSGCVGGVSIPDPTTRCCVLDPC